jgi:hypothetical protein
LIPKKLIKAITPYGLLRLYQKFARNRIRAFDLRKIHPLGPCPANPPRFIVTLTSYGRRVAGKAPYAVYSLFNQSVQPDKIVLYLARGTKIPPSLKKLRDFGLEIHFCEDIKSYTKLIPALSEFPADVLVTADDDVQYAFEWFKKLKEAYWENPQKIHCHRAHEIGLDENKNPIPYREWRRGVRTIEYAKRLFPTGVGGILYPPHSFNHEIFNAERFKKLAPTGDDIWFWAMARYNGKEFALVKQCITTTIDVGVNDDGLWNINVTGNKNDEQLLNVIKAYPDVWQSIV